MGQCPKCGKPVTAQQTACPACGAGLGPGTERVPAVKPAGGRPAGGVTPPRSSGGRPGSEAAKPRRARRSGTGVAIPAIVALILIVVLQQFISAVVPVDAYFYRLFRPAGGWVMGLVPGIIAFLLFWTLADLFLKYRVSGGDERDLDRPEIKQLPDLVAKEAGSVTLQRLRGWDSRILARPVGRRILWILRHLNAADAQRTHELLRHQSDVDSDSAASGYRTVKLFIWAMPIMGFIGTVLGISLAVGGFSDFLTTSVSIEEIDQVTAELGEVASGLSFAFDTTLVGLLAGLIATVASSGVERREERLLTRLDELGLRILANAKPAAAGVTVPASTPSASPAAAEEFEQMMRARLDELSGLMGHFTRAVHSQLGGLNDAVSGMSDGLETSIGSVGQTVDGLGGNLQGVSDTLARNMAGMEEANQRLQAVLASSSREVAAASDRLLAGVESQRGAEQAIKELSASISEFGVRLSDVRDAQVALAPVLSQLAGPLEIRLMPAGSPQAAPKGTQEPSATPEQGPVPPTPPTRTGGE